MTGGQPQRLAAPRAEQTTARGKQAAVGGAAVPRTSPYKQQVAGRSCVVVCVEAGSLPVGIIRGLSPLSSTSRSGTKKRLPSGAVNRPPRQEQASGGSDPRFSAPPSHPGGAQDQAAKSERQAAWGEPARNEGRGGAGAPRENRLSQ